MRKPRESSDRSLTLSGFLAIRTPFPKARSSDGLPDCLSTFRRLFGVTPDQAGRNLKRAVIRRQADGQLGFRELLVCFRGVMQKV